MAVAVILAGGRGVLRLTHTKKAFHTRPSKNPDGTSSNVPSAYRAIALCSVQQSRKRF